MSEEIWKDVPGYEGMYMASNTGWLFSVRRGRKMSMPINRQGYYCTRFSREGFSVAVRAHRVVLTTFKGLDPDRPFVNHINGVKLDNRIENLEWVTRSENGLHAFSIGLMKPLKGTENPNCKLTLDQVYEIRKRAAAGELFYKIAADYGISYSTVGRINSGRLWKTAA